MKPMIHTPFLIRRFAFPLTAALAFSSPIWVMATVPQPQNTKAPVLAYSTLTLKPGEGLHQVTLPWAIVQHSRDAGMADVFVINQQGRIVPQAWINASQPSAPVQLQALKPLPLSSMSKASRTAGASKTRVTVESTQGTHIEVTTDSSSNNPAKTPNKASGVGVWWMDLKSLNGKTPTALVIDVPQAAKRNGLMQGVDVEASADLQSWHSVGQGLLVEVIDPQTQTVAASQKRIPLQTQEGDRYLRIQPVQDGTSPDNAHALAQGIAVQAEVRGATQGPVLEKQTVNVQRGDDQTWTFNLPVSVPVQSIQVGLPEINSVIPLHVDYGVESSTESGSRQDQPVWNTITAMSAYRLQRGGKEWTSPAVQIPTTQASLWRLRSTGNTAWAQASSPAPTVTIDWRPPALAFAAQGNGPFQVVVLQSPNPQSPMLPLNTVVPGYQAGAPVQLPQATLGEVMLNVDAQAQVQEQQAAASHRQWVLWGALMAAVAGLSFFAWRLLQDMKKATAP